MGLNCPVKEIVIIWLDQSGCTFYFSYCHAWRQIWREELLCCFVNEMAAAIFVNMSDEDISQFLEEKEKKNTARKTSQELALFKTFLTERKLNDPEELTLLQLAHL